MSVMVDLRGALIIMDFGLARRIGSEESDLTRTGVPIGTPHYMSPEQATAEKEISARSDIYSLGSVLYEMLTGDPPHTGASAQQIIMKIIAEPVQPVTQLRKSVPPNVDAAVSKALEKIPADRFESAKSFSDALANSAFTTAIRPASVGDVTGAHGIVSTRVFAATIAVAVLATAGVMWTLRRPTIIPDCHYPAMPKVTAVDDQFGTHRR